MKPLTEQMRDLRARQCNLENTTREMEHTLAVVAEALSENRLDSPFVRAFMIERTIFRNRCKRDGFIEFLKSSINPKTGLNFTDRDFSREP